MTDKQPTYWDYVPDFSELWKSDNNYGQKLTIEGLYASITPSSVKSRGRTVITYTATVDGFNLPRLHRKDFFSLGDAKDWCESWLEHFYKRIMLEKQVACYKGWLDHYRDEFYRLKEKVDEREWQETYERIKAAHPMPMDGSEVQS